MIVGLEQTTISKYTLNEEIPETDDDEIVEIKTVTRGVRSNLDQTETHRYRSDARAYHAGKTLYSRSSDGQTRTYEYYTGSYNNGVFTEDAADLDEELRGDDTKKIVINGTVDSPEGIANKTTRTVTIYDDGKMVKSE